MKREGNYAVCRSCGRKIKKIDVPLSELPFPERPEEYGKNVAGYAKNDALFWLRVGHYAREGLIGQLVIDGFSPEDAASCVDGLSIDWRGQAQKDAEGYMGRTYASRKGLIGRLRQGGFSQEMAEETADALGIDWNDQAVKYAERYLTENQNTVPERQLRKELEKTGFTKEQISYAFDHLKIDWVFQAKGAAKYLLKIQACSRQSLIRELESYGFSREQVCSAILELENEDPE